MDRVGEEALRHVLQERAEKNLRIDAIELDVAGFDLLQCVVLQLGRKLVEGFAACLRLAMLVERGERLAIELGRRQRRLRPLLFRALGERPKLVEAAGRTVRPLQLAVDEDRATRILATGGLRIGRNDAIDDRLHGAGFV